MDIADANTIDDETLLSMCQEEQRQSVGFENDADLSNERLLALEYAKGEMKDVPHLKGRSGVVSTDVNDAIETVLPDLVEIFIGGEDTATFQPHGPNDEAAAKQETEFLNHVILNENDGFKLFYTAFKDALLSKTGVFKWWWEEFDRSTSEDFTGKTQAEVMAAQMAVQQDPYTTIEDVEPEEADPDYPQAEPTFSFTVKYDGKGGRLRVQAVTPEDFTVARDTVDLKDTTYCAMRTRPRAQDLIAQGYDPDKVAELPPYGAPSRADQVQQARDTAGEQTQFTASNQSNPMLRQVEVVEHFIRLIGTNGETVIWRVVAGASSTSGVVLEKEKVNRIQFSAICPYPQTHRFYGRSVADLLLEIQKIKTALMRMLLDSGYFALNQRLTVDTTKATEFTISDLLRNEPGVPIRVKGEGAVMPVQSPGLSFDATGALEFFSTVGEARTGIVRNAQGLNPDTLHDTATGAMSLMSAAQKRVRMIARIFAETGVRDMFLGAHEMIRTHCTRPQIVRLTGGWVQVDPTQWSERDDMAIEIGIGSGGQQHELQAGQQLIGLMQQIVQAQGGAQGPIVTLENAYNAAKRFVNKGLGIKGVDQYLTDPAQAMQQQARQGPQQPPPDPKMAEVNGKLQLQQQEMASDQQMQQARLASEQQQAQAKAQSDAQIAQAKIAADAAAERYKADLNLQIQREQIAADLQIKREQIAADERVKLFEAHSKLTQTVQIPDYGGVPGGPPGNQMGGPA